MFAADRLLRADIIRKSSDKYYAISWPLIKPTDHLKSAYSIVELYDTYHHQTGNYSPLHVRFTTVNKIKLEKLKLIQNEFIIKFDEIVRNDELDDNIPINLALVFAEISEPDLKSPRSLGQ